MRRTLAQWAGRGKPLALGYAAWDENADPALRSVTLFDRERTSAGYDLFSNDVDERNADERLTGSWRLVRPEIDRDLCTRCGLCFVRCPDGAVALDEEGYPVIDYEHCKGCMICERICPIRAIHGEKEVRAW